MKWRNAWLGVGLLPTVAFADGGGPILLIVNAFLFTVGQVWILLAEFLYLSRRAPSVRKARLFKLVLGVNALSTLGGAFIIPVLWATLFAVLSAAGPWRDSTLGGVLIALGTWVAGDNSPFPWLALTSSGILFVGTYFVTVWIEYRLLLRWQTAGEFPPPKELLQLSYRMNGISYIGLVVLFMVGVAHVIKF